MSHLHPGRRRSARLRPRTHASEEGAELPRPRSTRRSTQIDVTWDGAHVNHIQPGEGAARTASRRRSPRLHPQIHSTEEGDGMSRRRGTSPEPEPPASLPENDDLLWEVLLLLPPKPSSLPRASAVCKRWRGIVTDPKFLSCFYAHHRKPPLLGVFHLRSTFAFTSLLDPPDRIPPQRFSLGRYGCASLGIVVDCRHGRVLVRGMTRNEVIVCDPITTTQHRVSLPPEFSKSPISAAVLCAASEQGHVHGGCHSSPFKVVLVNMCGPRPIAFVYSSETTSWGNIISTVSPCSLYITAYQGSLVGNALYWLQHKIDNGILAFNLDEQSLAVIRGPTVTLDFNRDVGQIIQAENSALGLAVLSYPRLHMWQRNVNAHGVAIWLMWKTIEIHTILGLPPQIREDSKLSGYSEDTNAIFIYVDGNAYMVQLQSMECKRLDGTHNLINFYPFTSFYPPGEERVAAVVSCHLVCRVASVWSAVFICYLKGYNNLPCLNLAKSLM